MLSNETLRLFQQSLFAGHYNLLLGSGVSLDSLDKQGKNLMSTQQLSSALCALKEVKDTTPLARVSVMLSTEETNRYITIPYSACRPGETVKRLSSFVWKTAFTLNVDDALEAAYETASHPKQTFESINYDAPYKTVATRRQLPIVHLHGFTREPEKGYVFSTNEYARVTRGMNPWMHVLSELMASEPFIIAGTSLNESDLDFYLSSRNETSGRNNRGPSLFIEPCPDKLTENLCARHGLILVKAKLAEFLAWLADKVGNPPTVTELIIPSLSGIFKKQLTAEAQLSFFTRFELIKSSPRNPEGEISPFYFGRAVRWTDLESSLDVPTNGERELSAKARNLLSERTFNFNILCIVAESGTGKTTQIRRAAYDLAKDGYLVFSLNSKEAVDPENLIEALSSIDRPVALVIDGLADHASVLRTVIGRLITSKPVVVLSADRDYRRDHIDRVLGDLRIEYLNITAWSTNEYEHLLERIRKAGLLGHAESVHTPQKFAGRLVGDSVAIATCRALNNFRPLEEILRSLWKDADESARRSYAIAALGEHCYADGVFYPILEASYPNTKLSVQLELSCPLPLAYTEDGDYVLPLHPVIADRLLQKLSKEKPELLLEMFCALANALSPYVNRRAAIDRTPEARLAARLFNAESVARPLLRNHAEAFYERTREAWQWNSRYWEQRALFTQANDIDIAIQYARHAVAIEAHPFPWTTLASLLAKKMENLTLGVDALFTEIYDLLTLVFRHEAARSWRPTPHPYAALFHATSVFLEKGGQLPPRKKDWIIDQIRYCEHTFSRDVKLNTVGLKIAKHVATANDGRTKN